MENGGRSIGLSGLKEVLLEKGLELPTIWSGSDGPLVMPRSFDGYIALQLHSGGQGNMKFKHLYIRDLTRR